MTPGLKKQETGCPFCAAAIGNAIDLCHLESWTQALSALSSGSDLVTAVVAAICPGPQLDLVSPEGSSYLALEWLHR